MNRLLIIDDHPSVGEGTRFMVDNNNFEIEVACSGEDGVSKAKENQYDIYLVDLHMPDKDGLEVTKMIKSFQSDAVILIYSGYSIDLYFNLLVDAGISGFINKTASSKELNDCLCYALKGISLIPTDFFKELRQKESECINVKNKGEKIETYTSLNDREKTVLYYASQGKTNKEISEIIFISPRMVEYHFTKIFNKLNVKSRMHAVNQAKDLKLIPETM